MRVCGDFLDIGDERPPTWAVCWAAGEEVSVLDSPP